MIQTDCQGCRHVDGSAKDEPCWSCLGPGGERNHYERRDEPQPGHVTLVQDVRAHQVVQFCSLCEDMYPARTVLLGGMCAECRTLDAMVRQYPGRARKILRNILKEALKDE